MDFPENFDLNGISVAQAELCSQLRLTDDRGTHAEKKGPLCDVTHLQAMRKMVRLGKSGQRAATRCGITHTSRSIEN